MKQTSRLYAVLLVVGMLFVIGYAVTHIPPTSPTEYELKEYKPEPAQLLER